MKYYIKYLWIKLNIFVLKPIVWVQKKYEEYKEARLNAYVNYQIMMDNYFYNLKNK